MKHQNHFQTSAELLSIGREAGMNVCYKSISMLDNTFNLLPTLKKSYYPNSSREVKSTEMRAEVAKNGHCRPLNERIFETIHIAMRNAAHHNHSQILEESQSIKRGGLLSLTLTLLKSLITLKHSIQHFWSKQTKRERLTKCSSVTQLTRGKRNYPKIEQETLITVKKIPQKSAPRLTCQKQITGVTPNLDRDPNE
jgi:hypothetical protein